MKPKLLFLKLHFILISLTGLVFFSCKKEVSPLGLYTGYFYGASQSGIPLEMTENTNTNIIFNGNIVLNKNNDSIQGVFSFENEDYLVDPYVIGIWRQQEDFFFLSGHYAAVKDSATLLQGTFVISKNN